LSEDSEKSENVSLDDENKTLEIEGKTLKVNEDVKRRTENKEV
jgi:hypothetical protein